MRHRLLVLASLFSLACSAEEEGDDLDFRIINGQAASSSVPEYAATVGLKFKVAGNFFSATPGCSGTLVADDVVVTAGHCMVNFKGANASPKKASEVLVWFGQNSDTGTNATVSEVRIHPSFNPFTLANDIALVRLTNPTTVEPIPHLPASLGIDQDDVAASTVLDFVGFGYSNLAKTNIGVKLHNTLPIEGLGCPQSLFPECPANAPTTTQFSYSQVDGNTVEGPCNGDSGGPAFVDRSGSTYLAGITSYGDGPCTDYGVSTTVSAFEAFIDAFIDDGGAPDCSANGSCNAECAPGADPDCGGGGGSCGDGTCGDGESCDGRNGTTACSDCPGKVNGNPSTRFCFVEGACVGPGCP